MAQELAKILNIGARFAAGAAFGGGTGFGGRTAAGFSAISPGFRQFEESRAGIGRMEAETALRQGQAALTSAQFNKLQDESRRLREEERIGKEPIFFEDISRGFGKRNRKDFERTLMEEGTLREEGGKKFMFRKDAQGRKNQLMDTPEEKIKIAENEILDFKDDINDLQLNKNKAIDKLVKERQKLIDGGAKFDESIKDYKARLQSDQPGQLEIQNFNDGLLDIQQSMKSAFISMETQKDIIRKGKEIKAPTVQDIKDAIVRDDIAMGVSPREAVESSKDKRLRIKQQVMQSDRYKSDLQKAQNFIEAIRQGEKVEIDGVPITEERIIDELQRIYQEFGLADEIDRILRSRLSTGEKKRTVNRNK